MEQSQETLPVPDVTVCDCCGQLRPKPTMAGMWEYLEDPQFNPDGSLVTERKHEYLASMQDGKTVTSPVWQTRIVKVDQKWRKVNIVDVSHLGDGFRLLVVPVEGKRAIWWPERAIWRKVEDKPSVQWEDVICDGHRLGDGRWMGKCDSDGDSHAEE